MPATIDDSEAELARRRAGDPAIPAPTCATSSTRRTGCRIRRSRLLDVWSAVSVALAVLLLGGLLITGGGVVGRPPRDRGRLRRHRGPVAGASCACCSI